MACSIFPSECALRALPRIYSRPPRIGFYNPIITPAHFTKCNNNRTTTADLKPRSSFRISCFHSYRDNKWEEENTKQLNRGAVANNNDNNWSAEKNNDKSFDPGSPPPFNLGEIRKAIPKHCWVKNPWRSMSYVVRDIAVVFGLAAVAAYLNNWGVWPVYWFAQGTMFWALFVLGHDCGHGSFSNNPTLNSVVGHFLHSAILVPYHGWRISHRTHHSNHGHVEKDESWHPLTEKVYKNLDDSTKKLRFSLPYPLLAYPFYLWNRSPGKSGSHFNPDSSLFTPKEKKDVITSTVCWFAMLGLIACSAFVFGPVKVLKIYGVPYLMFVMWLDMVTYLHHHGYEQKLPWYRGEEWSYLRGGLTTVDRDYGWFNNIHHDIGTHVVHHLFPQIPHYHLIEATEAVKPILGKYYRPPKKSGPLPFHLIGDLVKSMKEDHYVSDAGEVVYYQTDPDLQKKLQGSEPPSKGIKQQ